MCDPTKPLFSEKIWKNHKIYTENTSISHCSQSIGKLCLTYLGTGRYVFQEEGIHKQPDKVLQGNGLSFAFATARPPFQNSPYGKSIFPLPHTRQPYDNLQLDFSCQFFVRHFFSPSALVLLDS